MDEGHEPERIEIELTSHDPAGAAARARRTRAVPTDDDTIVDAVVEAGEPGGPGWLGTERGRLLGVGAGAALVALVVGVLVGRIGSGGVESSEPAATTAAATTTTTMPGNSDTLPRAPDVLSPTTTRPDRTTTTTTVSVDGWTEGSIAIDPDFDREPVEIVALVGQGLLVRIDATTGATLSTQTSARFGQPLVSATDGWVLVPDDRGGFESVGDDGSRTAIDLGGWWPALTSGATAWRAEFGEPGQLTRLVQVSFDGTETGDVIDVDGFYPVATDPLGGVIVQASGGYYIVAPDSRERLTTGMLHAIGERTALVHECDDQLECGYFVIDRSSGAREPIDIDAQELENLQFGGFGWWSLGSPLSPTEDALVVVTFGAQGPAMGVLDLTSGSYTELRRFENEPQAAWSPSGRYLYWVDGGSIMAFDRSTGESVPFSDDVDRVVAIGARPLADTIDE